MAYLRSVKEKNGNYFTTTHVYLCDGCGREIPEAHPHYVGTEENKHFCPECAFVRKFITESQYLGCNGMSYSIFHAGVNLSGEIEVWTGRNKVAPWLRGNKEQRHSPNNVCWRASVFERDDYTCQDCMARGGMLNAHHLKSFKKFPAFRYAIDNGVTLCMACHKKRHRLEGRLCQGQPRQR